MRELGPTTRVVSVKLPVKMAPVSDGSLDRQMQLSEVIRSIGLCKLDRREITETSAMVAC